MSSTEAVQATNDDASECKRNAVQLGYWNDRYISLFIKSSERKAPEINRGYYARIRGIELFVEKFLQTAGNRSQIVNLGAGFDTLYWRLKDSGHIVSNFVELDYPNVTERKCRTIKKNKILLDNIYVGDGEVRLNATDLHAGNYHIVSCDLRNRNQVTAKLNEAEIDFQIPTLFIAECVLVYIEVKEISNLLEWITNTFKSALFINYEQVNMGDKFGDVMMHNLRARGCPLAGAAACQSLETQKSRFLTTGWKQSLAWDMVQVYDALPPNDRARIERIEFLDEHELLVQLFQHYCISIGWNNKMFDSIDIT